MEALVSLAPERARVAVRSSLLVLLVVYTLSVAVCADSSGLGLQVAQYWSVVAALLGQTSLLWRLLVAPRSTVDCLSIQALGLLSLCYCARLLEVATSPPAPRSDRAAVGEDLAKLEEDLEEIYVVAPLALLSVVSLALALCQRRRRRAASPEVDDNPVFALCGEAFGADLLRRFEGPRLSAARLQGMAALPLALLEHVLLPLAALVVGVLLEGLIVLLGGGDGSASTLRLVLSSWRSALLALALLPQLRALLALRREEKTGVVVPPDLKYWLTSAGVGHLFSFLMALYTGVAGAAGARALLLVCQEGFSTAMLGELLVAHFSAKCRGEKRLVLPT
mmetsp:Transcript_26404/g.87544  ORF Transcript_26404/g.87544 Transcript_26404/m.87544 type:complete len:336 (-) Transcript_26404:50-1057(-)